MLDIVSYCAIVTLSGLTDPPCGTRARRLSMAFYVPDAFGSSGLLDVDGKWLRHPLNCRIFTRTHCRIL